jgi:outer membrane protein TolC
MTLWRYWQIFLLICAACFAVRAQVLTRAEAVEMALRQASAFRQAQIAEKAAEEDVRQAKAAFYPRVTANPNLIYTSPSLGNLQTPRPPSFLGANAVSEYQGVVNTTGEIDTAGRLRATLRRNLALLEAARRGAQAERNNLIFAVNDAYFNLELAMARRRSAEENLRVAEAFEANVRLNLDAGEVAPVELTRARLQTSARRDELEQARTGETIAADILRSLTGYDLNAPVVVSDLLTEVPQPNEIETLSASVIALRPELANFDAQIRAAEQDAQLARGERRPQIVYSFNSGFISDSLAPAKLKNGLGFQASIGVSLPLFDRGASKSRETQANLRLALLQNQRELAARQFAQAFFSARTQAAAAAARIRLVGQSLDDARNNVNASLARYRAGEALITEVTDANNILIAQQNALYQAIFDYQTAKAKLLQAIGK